MQEASALLSAEIQLLLIDERTTMPPGVVDLLYSRVRSGVPGVPVLGIRSATNPGHIGHGRVKADYIKATDHGKREIFRDKHGRRRIFIRHGSLTRRSSGMSTGAISPGWTSACAGPTRTATGTPSRARCSRS